MCSDLRCDEWTTAASWTDQGLLQPESAHDFVRFEMPLPLADVALLNLDEIYMGGIGPRCRSISALIACGSRYFMNDLEATHRSLAPCDLLLNLVVCGCDSVLSCPCLTCHSLPHLLVGSQIALAQIEKQPDHYGSSMGQGRCRRVRGTVV